jgi:hypothetical protein
VGNIRKKRGLFGSPFWWLQSPNNMALLPGCISGREAEGDLAICKKGTCMNKKAREIRVYL